MITVPTSPTGVRCNEFIASLLERTTFPPAGSAVVCALSGGPDSAALVALAVAAGCVVEAVHVDHGLRPSSAADAKQARVIAGRLGVSLRCERIELVDGPNLEARARSARREVLGPDAMTGHTADDQAETALLALLRGAGATGLAAMTPGPRKPLLRLRRAETHAVCAMLQLQPAVDPSNDDPRFRRNRVRHEVIPLLDAVADRDTTDLIARTSDLLRDDDDFLNDLAAAIDPTDALALGRAPLPLARRALRTWLAIDGYPPDTAAIERVLAVAAGHAVSCQIAGGLRVERSKQRLALFSTAGRVR